MLNSSVNFNDPTGHESVCGQANSDPECGNLGHNPLSHPNPTKPVVDLQGRDDNNQPQSPLEELEEKLTNCSSSVSAVLPQCQVSPTSVQSQFAQTTQPPSPSIPIGISVQIEYLIYSYIHDINFSSPLIWRKTFTSAKAINPYPVVDAIVGAAGQVLTDSFNPNLSTRQRVERGGVAFVESGLTGIASDAIGFGVSLAGGGPGGYAAAQVVSSVALDNGFWNNYNHKYFGAAGY